MPDHIMTVDGTVVHVDYYTDGSIELWTPDWRVRFEADQLESILPKLEA